MRNQRKNVGPKNQPKKKKKIEMRYKYHLTPVAHISLMKTAGYRINH